MQINLSPQARFDRLTVSKSGDVLTINGIAYDFGPLPDGGTLPREAVGCDWLASDVERISGEIHLTLLLPHGSDAPEATRFPAPVTVTEDGPVALPPYDAEEADE
tara:strand:+ start:760 stop:1074 length:315 start_codon:yes stop_codon:yes gene_type:complete